MAQVTEVFRKHRMRLLATVWLLSVAMGFIASSVSGDWTYGTDLAVYHLVAVLCFAIGLHAEGTLRQSLATLILLYAIVLIVATVGATLDSVLPFVLTSHPSLWFGNANLLGAALVVAALAAYSVNARVNPYLVGIVMICALAAVTLTGSRTALAALIIGTSVGVACQMKERRRLLFGTMSIVVVLTLVVPPIIDSWSQPKNLLISSSDLTLAPWNNTRPEWIFVEHSNRSGPDESGGVHQIIAQSNPEDPLAIIIYQSTGSAVEGFIFVASVYLRADYHQVIVLSSNYTSVKCSISTIWSRCVTPPATGDGEGQIQWQIRARAPGEVVNLYMWGAQVEAGHTASPVEQTVHPNLKHGEDFTTIIKRFNVWSWLHGDQAIQSRLYAARKAWDMILEQPVAGYGRQEFDLGLSIDSGNLQVSHLHNIVLQHLFEGGLFGLISALLPLTTAIIMLLKHSQIHSLPLLIAIVILNTSDYTYFHAGGYYVLWLTLGLLAASAWSRTSLREFHSKRYAKS